MTTTAPDVLDRLRLAQRDEPVVTRDGVLAAEEAEPGHASDVRHGIVGRIEGEPAKVWQPDERRQPRRGDAEFGRVQIQSEKATETFELRHAAIRERTAQQEVVRAGVIAQEAHLRLAAMPALEDRNLVQQRETGVGHGVAGSQLTQARLPRECTEGTVAGRSALEINVAEALASGQIARPRRP